ncbi:MAG: 50S ribosomal protein L19 [Planctomycetes bacterium]|nr:50S ribosomal protein L19 [Planctomycetota bacterium]
MTTIRDVEQSYLKAEIPGDLRVGDSVAVGLRIREGDKERIQTFHGVLIAKRRSGIQATITVRRIVAGEGVELTVPLHSPRLADVKVNRRGRVRRAKLYYLRDRVGKATRLREDLRASVVRRRKDAAKARTEPAAEDRARVSNEPTTPA